MTNHFIALSLYRSLALALLLAGCANPRPSAFKHPYDLNNPRCRIGVLAESDGERIGRKIFNKAEIVPFDDIRNSALQLLSEKIDGIIYDEHVLRLAQWNYPDRFEILEQPLDTDPSVIGVSATRPDLLAKLNRFIADARESGLYDEMFLRWCHDPGRAAANLPVLPDAPEMPKDAPVIRVGTDPIQVPNSFFDDDGNLRGYDVEFIRRFAVANGFVIQFEFAPEQDLLEQLGRAELDVVVANLAREDFRGGILWTDGYLDSDIMMMVKIPDEPK